MSSLMSPVDFQRQLYDSYQLEICYLQRHGNILLQQIKNQEMKMNLIKQQNQQPTDTDINLLNAMITKLLRMLAFINTYRYYQVVKQPLAYNNNHSIFMEIANEYYKDLRCRFLIQLRIKRMQLHSDIHFEIVQ